MRFRIGLTLVRLPTCCRLRIPVLGSGEFLETIARLREPFRFQRRGCNSLAPTIPHWLNLTICLHDYLRAS